jgi:LemA protein
MSGKGCAFLALGAIALIAFVTLIGGCSAYQSVVSLDEGVKSQWSQVENQLQRRFDLIPNLVETVKGYAAHEKGVFDDIAHARESYFQAKSVNDKAQAASSVESALSRLLMLQENYPVLKANEGFLKLQDQLEGTENRIAVERQRYNDAVRALNAAIRGPMGSIANTFAHAERAEYFKIPEAAKTAPRVDFSAPASAPAPAAAAPSTAPAPAPPAAAPGPPAAPAAK